MSEGLIGNAKVAADLAAAGFSVFPCHAGGEQAKRPMPGVFWRSASTSDHVKVAGWWKRWPEAAVGLDLAKSGIVVIDADRHGDEDGVGSIAELMHANGFDPNPVPTVATPNQGTHFYFRQPPGSNLGNGRGSLPAGVDVRGSGGYVIAPGSAMADGRLYEGFGFDAEIPVLPNWLFDIIATKAEPVPVMVPAGPVISDTRVNAYVDAAVSAEIEAVRSAPRGTRNQQLNRSAFALGQLVGAGLLGDGEVSAMLENAASDLTRDDGPAQTRKTIRSGLMAGKRDPRQLPVDQSSTVSIADYEASARILSSFQARELADPTTGEVDATDTSDSGAVDQFDLPDGLLHPPGVVGELADWMCSWTSEPIRVHAVAAALTIVGTLLGRKVYSRIRPTSTALYVGAIAPTGMGKQHAQDCIRLALDAAGAPQMHMGWNVSLPAIVVALQQQASKVMIADEFADKLIGLRSKNASTSQAAISEGLRTVWGTNTGTYSPDISLSRGDGKIMRPALSFYGAATIKDFTRSLISKDITNGLFNRFLILPRFGAVTKQAEPDGIMSVPEQLKQRLQWMTNCLPPMQGTMAARGDGYPQPILVPFTSAAEAMNKANKDHQDRMLTLSEQDDALMLWGRFAEQVKRIALIVACGRHPEDLSRVEIDADDMRFAETLVRYSIEQFVLMVRRDMVENWIEANRQKVLGVIRGGGMVTKAVLLRKVRNIKAREIDEILGMLEQAESIVKLTIETGGRSASAYKFLRD